MDVSCEELLRVRFDKHALFLGLIFLLILEPFLVFYAVVTEPLLNIDLQIRLELVVEELVLETLIYIRPVFWFGFEHFLEKIKSLLVGIFELFYFKVDSTDFIGLHDFLAVVAIKGLLSC